MFRVWVPCPRYDRGLQHFRTNTRVPGWVLRQFWLRKKGEARSNTKKLMTQSGSWCKVDSCGAHLNICDFSLNAKVCHSIEERARTFTDVVQDFEFSKGTHVDLRSQSDPPEG